MYGVATNLNPQREAVGANKNRCTKKKRINAIILQLLSGKLEIFLQDLCLLTVLIGGTLQLIFLKGHNGASFSQLLPLKLKLLPLQQCRYKEPQESQGSKYASDEVAEIV